MVRRAANESCCRPFRTSPPVQHTSIVPRASLDCHPVVKPPRLDPEAGQLVQALQGFGRVAGVGVDVCEGQVAIHVLQEWAEWTCDHVMRAGQPYKRNRSQATSLQGAHEPRAASRRLPARRTEVSLSLCWCWISCSTARTSPAAGRDIHHYHSGASQEHSLGTGLLRFTQACVGRSGISL